MITFAGHPFSGRTKYLLRLRGEFHLCSFCEGAPVVAALVDEETDNSLAVCADHFDAEGAVEDGLRVVNFTAPVIPPQRKRRFRWR